MIDWQGVHGPCLMSVGYEFEGVLTDDLLLGALNIMQHSIHVLMVWPKVILSHWSPSSGG